MTGVLIQRGNLDTDRDAHSGKMVLIGDTPGEGSHVTALTETGAAHLLTKGHQRFAM